MERALLTSLNSAYLTPPVIVARVHRMVRMLDRSYAADAAVQPCVDLPPFGDYFTNDFSIVGARFTANRELDGTRVDWGLGKLPYWPRAYAYANPPYGDEIVPALETMVRFGSELRTCDVVGCLPARPDTTWCQEHVFLQATAWIWARGRFTFWREIPIDDPRPEAEREPLVRAKGETPTAFAKRVAGQPQWLRRHWPKATADDLPKPFERSRVPGFAVGPELAANGKPSPAPFPSLLPYYGPHTQLFEQIFGGLGAIAVPRGPRAGVRVVRKVKVS